MDEIWVSLLYQNVLAWGRGMSMGLCECVYRGVMFAHSTQGSVWHLSRVSPSVMRTQGPVKGSLSVSHSLMSPFVQLFTFSESADPLDTEHILSSWDCNWSKSMRIEANLTLWERENERVWVESESAIAVCLAWLTLFECQLPPQLNESAEL